MRITRKELNKIPFEIDLATNNGHILRAHLNLIDEKLVYHVIKADEPMTIIIFHKLDEAIKHYNALP